MNTKVIKFIVTQVFIVFSLAGWSLFAQEYDTITNWDGIEREWYVSTSGSGKAANPAPDEMNGSAHCFRFVTDEGSFEYMITELDELVDFSLCPRYRIKVLAPESGGNITLKFENYNNSFWQEIVLTPVPGQWTDLEYDFSGLVYDGLIKMVIFPDFQGNEPGNYWYIDDILREACAEPEPLQLETNLPIIVINTFGEPIVDEPKIEAHMGIIDNGPGEINSLDDPFNNYDGMIGIETRGQSSQMFPKKSYGFETRDAEGENLDTSLLGLPEENDWVLYAPYSDKSMLRNFMSFEMGSRMGNYCTRQVFCELVINDDYKGIYTLMEKIKKDDDRVDIATLNPDEISGDDLTGGYIIKVDKLDWDFEFDSDGWRSDPDPPYPNAMDIIFQYYYPEADEMPSQQKIYIRDYITDAENALTSFTFSMPEIGYMQYFDVLSYVDFMLLCEISKEVDKYRYSTYMYKEKDSDGGKLFAGPLWDFDLGYGNVDYWPEGLDYTGWLYYMVNPYEWSIMFWWKRLMEDPYFRNMAKTRWEYLRQERLSDEDVHQMIDSVVNLLEDARVRNFERWPILGEYVWPNYDWFGNTYEDEVDYFEDFLFNRLQWMDGNFTGNLLFPWASISAQENKISLALYDDFFATRVLKKSWFTLNDAPAGVTVLTATYKDASHCELYLSEDISGAGDLSVTVSHEAINYWLDLTSNRLEATGAGELPGENNSTRVYWENQQLVVINDHPLILPGNAEIFNLAGQKMACFGIDPENVNRFSLDLKPGLYIVTLKNDRSTSTHKIIVR
ncbi:MAG TPA: CotH kinase family protein [Bacteroidales bacterium]|nr:CotH kinase family protein [Bacteroidales bacterium]